MIKRWISLIIVFLLIVANIPQYAYAESLDEWNIRSPLPTGNTLTEVTFGNGTYVAVGSKGTILTSSDGASWTGRASGTTNLLYDVIYANGMFVTVGAGGTILTSSDGASWTSRTSTLTSIITSIAYGNSFVAVGAGGRVLTSSNGVNWTSQTSGTSNNLMGVDYGNSMYVAVGNNGTIVTSSNGTSWTNSTSGYALVLSDIAFGNGLFVALGQNGRTLTSTNGVNWLNGSTNSLAANGISFDNGNFAAVGSNGAILTSSSGASWTSRSSGTTITLTGVTNGNGTYVVVGETIILTSPDGISWTDRMIGTLTTVLGVSYFNGMYLALGAGGTIITSSDGVSWTNRASGTTNHLYGVAYGNELYVAVGINGTIVSSSNGVNWTVRTSGTTNQLTGVTYGNDTFVAVGAGGIVITSGDGVNWTSQPSSTANNLKGVTYGNGMYVAVGNSGTIVTSSNGVSWTSRASGTGNILNGVTYGNDMYVAVGNSGTIVTSNDGISWTSRTSGIANHLNGATYGNGMYVAVGATGTIVTSGNGASWRSRASGNTNDFYSVAYGYSTYLAGGGFGAIVQSGIVPPAINSVSVSPTSANVAQGGSKQLTAAVDAINGVMTTVKWTSSDAKVAVDGTGNVTVAADAALSDYTITATSTVDGSKKGTATITVTAAALPETTPEAVIDYTAEQLTGLAPNGTYTINGTAVTADGSGKVAIDGSWLGVAVNVVKKGNGTTTTDSTAQTISLPSRPAMPTAGKTDETSINGSNGTLTNVTSAMAYKKGTAGSWTSVTGTSVTELAPDTYYVRVKATSSAFASVAQTVTIAAFIGSPETTPGAGIDYTAEQLTGLAPNGTYTINGTAVTADSNGKVAIDGSWLGAAVNVVKKGNGTTTTDSTAQTISLPSRPAIPTAGKTDETSINGNNGTLTNVTSAVEYRKGTAGSWTSVTGTNVTELAPDTYYVRVKATSSAFASVSQTVTIAAFIGSPETTPVAVIAYTAEQLTGLAPNSVYMINGTSVTTDGNGKVAIDGSWLGVAVNVVKKGNGTTTTDSTAQTISLPSRPAMPTAGKTDETSINGSNGTLTNVTSAVEFRKGAAGSWTSVTDTNVTELAPDTYYVRFKATSSAFASEAQTVTITAYGASLEPTPEVVIDYAAEQLTGLEPNGTYTINGTAVTANGSGKVVIDGSWLGTNVNVVKKGNGTTTADSTAQMLSLPSRPAAPVDITVTDITYNGANDGSILNVNHTMEFKIGNMETWTNITGTSVVGLAPSVYYVRVAATESAFASIPAQATIHDSDATIPAAPNVSAEDASNVMIGLDTTMEFSVDGGAYVRYDGTNMPQLSGEHTVQVRVAASGSVPAGPSTTLIFTTNASVSAGGLTVTAIDPSSAANDGKTRINVTPAADGEHRLVYFNFGSGIVDVPNVGDTLSGYLALPSDRLIPAANGDKIGVAEVDAQGKVVKFGQTAAHVIAEQPVTQPSNGVSTGPNEESVDVLVNGKVENAGKATTTESGGVKTTTIVVDPAKLQSKLDAEGMNAVVTIPVKSASNVIVGELNGQMVKNMENLSTTLVLQTNRGTYTLPALEINIDEIAGKLGSNVKLEDIQLKITVAQTPDAMAKVVESAASKGEFSIVVPAVDFTVTGTYGGKTIEIKTYNVYVERMVALPDGIDPNRITTGVVVEPDGSVRHVPTKIILVEGKYYAIINSLTNSTYTVVWHPIAFADVEKHWAKEAVNDMGSRLVIHGVNETTFNPNADITRAEFVAMIVRALGLRLSEGSQSFSDVATDAWYASAIQTALDYGLISGFEDGTFQPNTKITREQAMVVVAKTMKLTGLAKATGAPDKDVVLGKFADSGDMGTWATDSIVLAAKAGLINGRSGGKLEAKANVTRAEVATLIQRLLKQSDLI
ncbi:S-layer homology domain-containing protein [Paenibacillus sinopodophylli]|uniref:S-layer homology domain-containing protein n=1 Tax=Paenibacillus sinopodophylli TaxID=1837342 RepID=UPI00110D0353|nr:S-layer homology domain-containing protein [Paenibacillus sinopodophylli]